jgi:phage-related tail fiber protein
MPNIIRIKRRNIAGAPGSPLNLTNAELAFNEADYTLYYGYGSNGPNNTATIIVPIAGSGAFLPRAEFNSNATIFYTTGTQIVTGAKTFNRGLYSITPLVSDSGTTVATTAFVKNQSYLTGNQNITFTGDATGTGSTSVILTLANTGIAGTYTKVTTDSKGRVTSGRTLASGDIPTIDVSQVYNFDTQVRTNRLDQLASPTSNVNLNSQNIINLADPINAQDAATKAYVDATKQGLDIKDSVRAATVSNITLSGVQTIDGVVLNIGDRVLVKEQSSAGQNGIYIVSDGSWTRSSDANTNPKVSAGLFVFVEEGGNNGDCGFVLITNNPITLGTTSLSFTQFNGAGQVYAASGITKTRNTFSAVGTSGRIAISANGIDIANTYIGQTSISTLGTITTGIWNGSVISSTYGGLGLSSVLSGLIQGNGSSYSAAVAGIDYASAAHMHIVSDIADFNSSVSGILPVKNIVAGSNITISSSNGNYTINSNGSAVNDDQNILANQIFG